MTRIDIKTFVYGKESLIINPGITTVAQPKGTQKPIAYK